MLAIGLHQFNKNLNSAFILQQKPNSDDVIEVGKIYIDGSNSLDDTRSLIAGAITSITEDDISTSSTGQSSDISRRAKRGLTEKNLTSNVPSKKWWNLFRYFQRSPKSQHIYGNFSYDEILVATNNFSYRLDIDFGGSETVCKGQTDDGKSVVVLRSYLEDQTPPTIHELQLILGISPSGNHAPATSLTGYYVDKNNVILLFDDIDPASCSLHDHLHNHVREPLSWKQRLTICIDAARVHKCLLAVKMQFWNLTSENIFVDESLNTNIDLYSAASKICTNNHVFQDSDYIRDGKAREKTAVFSLGILLFEVLCAGEALRHWLEMNPATVAEWTKPGSDNNYIRHMDP